MADEPIRLADEVTARVVEALAPRFDSIDQRFDGANLRLTDMLASIEDLKKGQKQHSRELGAVRDMLDNDTAPIDSIEKIEAEIEKLQRSVARLRKKVDAKS